MSVLTNIGKQVRLWFYGKPPPESNLWHTIVLQTREEGKTLLRQISELRAVSECTSTPFNRFPSERLDLHTSETNISPMNLTFSSWKIIFICTCSLVSASRGGGGWYRVCVVYGYPPASTPLKNKQKMILKLKNITSFVNVRAQYCLIKLPPFACMFCILRADTPLSLHARRRKRNSCNRVFSLELPSPNSCTRQSSLVPSFVIKV